MNLLTHATAGLTPGWAPSLQIQVEFAADRGVRSKSIRIRHATCSPSYFLEKDSHSWQESVDFSNRRATIVLGERRKVVCLSGWNLSGWNLSGWNLSGRNHSAARNGNRKRTRVRVACGGSIRPPGLGHQPIHGHNGLSVVSRDFHPPVVHRPACEFCIRQRRFSRGTGLLAALTSRHAWLARLSAFKQQTAHQQAVGTTRSSGFNVIRAASVLICLPERPAAGRGAHQPSPRTRLR